MLVHVHELDMNHTEIERLLIQGERMKHAATVTHLAFPAQSSLPIDSCIYQLPTAPSSKSCAA